MKKITSKKLIAFTLFLFGIFFSINLTAQTCNGNKVWACRYTQNCTEECKCVSINNAGNWVSHGKPFCQCFYGCPVRLADPSEELNAINFYPNPVSTSATIHFVLDESGMVSISIMDITGRFIAQIAYSEYAAGSYDLSWAVSSINAGIYFLRMESGNFQTMERISVVK